MENRVKAVLELVRLRNSLISFLGVIVGMLLVSTVITVDVKTIAAAVTAMLVLGGGNALNDYYDIEADKINRPSRPIPSGRISRKNAIFVSIMLFLAGIITAFYINIYCTLLALVNSCMLVAYAKYSKKALLVSNITVGYLTASVFIYGALSIYQTPEFNPNGIEVLAVLVISSFFMTLSREVIKDIEDLKGDSKEGAKTLPTEVGIPTSKKIAISMGLIAVFASLVPIAKEIPSFNTMTYTLFIIPTNLIFISSYFKEPNKNQKLLVAGMAVSLIAFLAGRVL